MSAGLVRWAEDPAAFELAPDGTALYERVQGAIARTAAGLWRGFDPGDLAITRRVLLEVTERSKAQVAR